MNNCQLGDLPRGTRVLATMLQVCALLVAEDGTPVPDGARVVRGSDEPTLCCLCVALPRPGPYIMRLCTCGAVWSACVVVP
jgi:hypothetical protein